MSETPPIGTLSPDGQWTWDGERWIPSTPAQTPTTPSGAAPPSRTHGWVFWVTVVFLASLALACAIVISPLVLVAGVVIAALVAFKPEGVGGQIQGWSVWSRVPGLRAPLSPQSFAKRIVLYAVPLPGLLTAALVAGAVSSPPTTPANSLTASQPSPSLASSPSPAPSPSSETSPSPEPSPSPSLESPFVPPSPNAPSAASSRGAAPVPVVESLSIGGEITGVLSAGLDPHPFNYGRPISGDWSISGQPTPSWTRCSRWTETDAYGNESYFYSVDISGLVAGRRWGLRIVVPTSTRDAAPQAFEYMGRESNVSAWFSAADRSSAYPVGDGTINFEAPAHTSGSLDWKSFDRYYKTVLTIQGNWRCE